MTGTLSSSKWVTPAKSNAGLNNSSTGAYVNIPQNARLNPSTPNLTVSAWINIPSYPNNTGYYGAIVQGSGNLNNATGYYLGLHGWSPDIMWAVGSAGGWDAMLVVPRTTVPLNQWALVTATLEPGYAKLYVNGVLQGTDTHNISSITYGSYPITIGALSYIGYFGHNTNGNIDDVRIYNRPLAASEMTSLYNNGTGCIP